MEKRILGLDLGGTFIKYCLFNENDEFLLKGKEMTPSNIEDFIVLMKELVNHIKPIEGIAISMPGFIDAKSGYAKTGGAIKYLDDTNIVKLFKELFHVWVSVENDGRCATLAELETGNLKDVNNGIAIIVGTAIGGGIVVNREVLRGKHLIAGEISFMSGIVDEYPSYNSIFATYCGAYGIYREVEKTTGIKNMSGIEAFERIKNGDKKVEEALKTVCHRLAVYLYNLQVVIDPEKFVIGGGISAEPLFIQYIQEGIDDICSKNKDLPVKPNVDVCLYRNDANLLGALYNYKKNKK